MDSNGFLDELARRELDRFASRECIEAKPQVDEHVVVFRNTIGKICQKELKRIVESVLRANPYWEDAGLAVNEPNDTDLGTQVRIAVAFDNSNVALSESATIKNCIKEVLEHTAPRP